MSSRPPQKLDAKLQATADLLAASKLEDTSAATSAARNALDAGAVIDAVDGRNATALYNAVENCNLPLVNLLIEREANVNKAVPLDPVNRFTPSMEPWDATQNNVYCSPLHCAAHADPEDESYDTFKKIVGALIKAGASLKVRDVQGCTPRETAEYYGGLSTLSRLIEDAEQANRAPDAETLKAKKVTSTKSRAG